MKDEIKEILRYLRIENGHCSSELSYEETHLLLDYITNLQNKAKELEQINEEHRKINGELRKTNNEAIRFVESMKYCGQEDYFYDEQSQDPNGNDNMFEDSKTKLLNILQGSDE